ncbi:hypothetical protein BDV93DRAFT_518872 [Ceratobasidium sp. AG-I]|nr:hypothetical protein BDV93DRAFT_518872 [Ceratobasidium sp. AG-I]
MQRRKSQVYVELPPLPLSKRNDNATGAASPHLKPKGQVARPSLSMMRVEIPVKTPSSKIKRAAGTQNIEPGPSASDHATTKRKRSASDLAGSGGPNTKKPRESEQTTKAKMGPSSSTKPAEVAHKVPVPQPKWTQIPVNAVYDEIMQRMQLREFLARFQPLTKFAHTHLDTLSRLSVFTQHYLPRETLKAALLALLDLVGADANPDSRRGCQTAIKHIRAAKGNLDISWDALSQLRETCYSKLPSPEQPPDNIDSDFHESSEDDGEAGIVTRRASKAARLAKPSPPPKDRSLNFSLVCGAQFLPILLFLAELALQGPSVRSDIDAGLRVLATAAHKAHLAKLAEEKARWATERQKFASTLSKLESNKSDEKAAKATKDGKAVRCSVATATKIKEAKAKRKYAEAKHQQAVRSLTVAYNQELRACAGRGTYLGSDRSGRQYYAIGSAPKTGHGESRWDYWSTFVACWGKRAGASQPHWYGFDEPAELRTLAGVVKEGAGSEPVSGDGIDLLAKGLLNIADFLEDRLDG